VALLDDLRAVENFPPSHEPTQGELGAIVGRLVAYVEHGDKLFEAADKDREGREAGEPSQEVAELVGPTPAAEDAGAPGSSSSSGPTPADAGAKSSPSSSSSSGKGG
jgi:hypothetical protein